MTARPDRSEVAEYYFTYIDQVPDGDICAILESDLPTMLAQLRAITEEGAAFRYAPGKWSVREVLSHVNDTERLFVFRAFWFARGFDTALPSFDQDAAITTAGAEARSWRSHVDEFAAIRAATVAFFKDLPDEAWMRRGIASDNPFTVRALAWITAGHAAHHARVLRERYLQR
ncbi:MAG TPA: DinB family protein [Gemmatimonadaceae bacterium]